MPVPGSLTEIVETTMTGYPGPNTCLLLPGCRAPRNGVSRVHEKLMGILPSDACVIRSAKTFDFQQICLKILIVQRKIRLRICHYISYVLKLNFDKAKEYADRHVIQIEQ